MVIRAVMVAMMKRRRVLAGVLGSIVLCSGGLQAESPGPPKRLAVYLLIGQSNMAGRAPVGEADAGVITGAFLLNGEDQWEPAKNPLNRYSTIRKGLGMQKMNPGYRFAQVMLEGSEGGPIGLVVNAKGGTRIEQWAKGTQFYQEAVRRAKLAAKGGTLKGILWHQGESNSSKPEGYLKKLEALIEDLRQDLDAPELPFVAGQLNDREVMNAEIAKLPATVAHTGVAGSEGLTAMDRSHFDTRSMKLLGERYAQEMQRLHARQKAATSGK